MKTAIAAAIVLAASAGQVFAGCEHDGVIYDVGAVICSGGWQQECTPAGYWSAIGQCKVPDARTNDSARWRGDAKRPVALTLAGAGSFDLEVLRPSRR